MSTIIETTVVIDNGPAVAGKLTVETERIDVTSATETRPDPDWEFIDAAGHFHAWSTDKDHELPTLDARSEHVDCDFGHSDEDYECEGYEITVYSCSICAEIIEPATITKTPTFRRFVNGLTSWEVVAAVEVEPGKRVSVRIDAGGTTYYGIATVTGTWWIPDATAGQRASTMLVGVSPLGRRKNAAVPVGS